jgi:hypothetical protein
MPRSPFAGNTRDQSDRPALFCEVMSHLLSARSVATEGRPSPLQNGASSPGAGRRLSLLTGYRGWHRGMPPIAEVRLNDLERGDFFEIVHRVLRLNRTLRVVVFRSIIGADHRHSSVLQSLGNVLGGAI